MHLRLNDVVKYLNMHEVFSVRPRYLQPAVENRLLLLTS